MLAQVSDGRSLRVGHTLWKLESNGHYYVDRLWLLTIVVIRQLGIILMLLNILWRPKW